MNKNISSGVLSYKNIDRRTQLLLDDPNEFSVLSFDNPFNQSRRFQFHIKPGHLILFFALNNSCEISFLNEVNPIELEANQNALVYFPERDIEVNCKLDQQSHLYIIVTAIGYFHKILKQNNNAPSPIDFNVNKVAYSKVQEIDPQVKVILHQFHSKKIDSQFKALFVKGKVLELLSIYLNSENHIDTQKCPFMSDYENISKIKHAKDIIIEEMANPPSLEDLSKQIGLNIKQLKTGFKAMYGLPVYAFLLNYKMDYARKLILQENIAISELSTLLGYSSSSHFIAAFKKKYKLSPKQFLKSVQSLEKKDE